jgi:hypothetical protein
VLAAQQVVMDQNQFLALLLLLEVDLGDPLFLSMVVPEVLVVVEECQQEVVELEIVHL